MELNAKLASLEDEVKLLKGEVKLILSEIRTAILGQDNPFAEPGQALRADPGALESRPPIRVVHIPSEEEEPEAEEEPKPSHQVIWPEETEASQPAAIVAETPPPATQPEEPAPSPPPSATRQPQPAPPTAQAPESAPSSPPAPPVAPTPMPAASPTPAASTAMDGTPRWSLITVAGLAVWAEEAVRQIGSDRLRILLDLCEFTGYLSGSAKEALLKVTSLGLAAEDRTTPPSANECLVVLCQLDALMRGEEPAGLSLRNLTDKWRQLA